MTIGKLILSASRGWKIVCVVFVFCAATAIGSSAQTLTTLVSFDGTDGNDPHSGLIQGFDGNFYGTTVMGGTNGLGTVFKTTPEGTLTTIYSFCAEPNCTDGENPYGRLVQGRDGNFYGTTSAGGILSCGADKNGCGTIFKLTRAGILTTLHAFAGGADGSFPGGLLQGFDGNFYGEDLRQNDGAVFKMTATGALTTLHTFSGPDGGPGGLMQATDGNFYGITFGGSGSAGTVFKLTPTGTLTTLHGFSGSDGAHPVGLVQASDGNFYGTTSSRRNPILPGTVFKMTPAGDVSVLYSFCAQTNCPDGYPPDADLVQGTDGNLYGTTELGGAHVGTNGCGTVFQITTAGTLATLHTFQLTDGCNPTGGLLQATDGNFYGTTYGGGSNGIGTIFGLNMSLGPFVATNPTAGKAGRKVGILGANLKGATAVSFNGTAAKFSVVAKTTIVATVPAGATTGFVTVTTPSGTLTSNVVFQVIP
jgi:uncharacterized repeat protein (TIGR03803 family)